MRKMKLLMRLLPHLPSHLNFRFQPNIWNSRKSYLFASSPPLPTDLYHRLFHGDPGSSYGLNSALAARGVIVEDKVFLNLSSSELKQKGATVTESLSGLPIRIRGTVTGESSEISKAQFSKLLKQVTSHLSSISNIFVHDGAIGSSSRCSARVRVISDNPSAALSLSNILWSASTRAVSHDTCPVTVYVASSISGTIGNTIGLDSQESTGLIAADTERSSLILCGKAFADAKGVKQSLAALSEPIIAARGGIPLAARILELGDLVILVFAPEDVIRSFSNQLVSAEAGVVLASQGKAIISGVIPAISKLSPGQAAYHFLAGYQNGKYIPAYNTGPSCIDPLELSKALLSKLKDNSISSFLINVSDGDKYIPGKNLVEVVHSTLIKDKQVSFFQPKGGDLKVKFKRFLSSKYPELPNEFSY